MKSLNIREKAIEWCREEFITRDDMPKIIQCMLDNLSPIEKYKPLLWENAILKIPHITNERIRHTVAKIFGRAQLRSRDEETPVNWQKRPRYRLGLLLNELIPIFQRACPIKTLAADLQKTIDKFKKEDPEIDYNLLLEKIGFFKFLEGMFWTEFVENRTTPEILLIVLFKKSVSNTLNWLKNK